jgi:lambda family phage tail tape measure protein
VNKPIQEAAARDALANAKVITDLERQLLGIKDARQAFIDQAVSRLSEKAGDANKAKTRDLAEQLFDQKAFTEAEKVISDLGKQMDKLGDKRKAFVSDALARLPETTTQEQIDRAKKYAETLYDQGEAIVKLDKLKQEGKQLTDSTATATEAYTEKVARLNEMLAAGAITQEVYNRGKAKATDTLLENSKDPLSGAIRAFHKYRDEAEDSATAVEKAFTEAMKATEDAIVNMVTTGEFSLNNLNELANSVVEDITRMAVKSSMSGLFDWVGGMMGGGDSGGGGSFLDDIFSAIFHEGGKAGDPAPLRQVPSYVFAGAPRYHSGGIAGLKPDEIPAILQRGEVVLPKNSRSSAPVTVVMNISTQDANSFRASQAQVTAEAARGIQRARRNL